MRTTVLMVIALAATAGVARAQDAAQAEQLFKEGKAAMAAGKLGEACELFAASERLDASPATLMNLGDCREKNGQLASAWEAFVAAERRTRGDGNYGKMAAIAGARAASLEPRLSYLTINVPDEVRVEGLQVMRDGALIEQGAWNRALPIDGGEHVITGRAPGHEAWSTRISVAPEGERQAVEVPRFKAIRNPAGAGKTVIITRSEPPLVTPRRKVAIGVAAGGVAAIVAGAVLGLRSQRLDDDAADACPDGACDEAAAAEANRLAGDARTMAIGANVAFAVGGAAIATGAVLWITGAPRRTAEKPGALSIAPHTTPSYVGLSAAVRF